MRADPRDPILHRLREDLIGPMDEEEVIRDRPSDRYLTGIIWPADAEIPAVEDDGGTTAADGADEDDADDDPVPLTQSRRPSTAGLSFAVQARAGTRLRLRVQCGTYQPRLPAAPPDQPPEHEEEERSARTRKPQTKPRPLWARQPHDVSLFADVTDGAVELPVSPELPGLSVYVLCTRHPQSTGVTVVLRNRNVDGETRNETEERCFFQVKVEVSVVEGRLVARPARTKPIHEDDWSAALIYRNAEEFAVGHTCAASWTLGEDGTPSAVSSCWLPEAVVPAVTADGSTAFASLGQGPRFPLSARWLSDSSDDDLIIGLRMVPDLYRGWLAVQAREVPDLPAELQPQAERHLAGAEAAARRMDTAIDLIRDRPLVRRAFRLAASAMRLQRRWSRGEADLVWRPFQLGFQLLCLDSLVRPEAPDRSVMDLLWFPTGGGKTEAYLALVAFELFYRRLAEPGQGAGGVAVLMRYTLRLLTIQQFQRAAALIMACEFHRRRAPSDLPIPGPPFSVGLWVGGGATPNTVQDARNPDPESESTAAQLQECPACKARLRWTVLSRPDSVVCSCESAAGSCEFAETGGHLPVWTVDEDIYRERPSLLIGTVDKFAQIVRKAQTGRLFGLDGANRPPDLIIQDELHLISGPLGTMTALYEVAIDEFCTRDGVRPKVIGSTATIRRASDQVAALFNRVTFQFPPPILSAGDSCFASTDRARAGRRYIGLTSAGRSPKFALQAVCASLLQSVHALPEADESRDWYWTMVAYFKALRELGAALVLMLDDVQQSMNDYAARRGEQARQIGVPIELTSRLKSSEIPVVLKNLEGLHAGDAGAYDVLLASNMISVGVDVDRLNLMVVSGQPKGMSEYIQATSRVGRRWPGQVVCVYNHGRVRDRSHYEAFSTWHAMLYREVEATSVTPFASRAQDRALHAVLVALARHLVPGMLEEPTLTPPRRRAVEDLARRITARVANIPAEVDELGSVEQKIAVLLDEWEARGPLRQFWNDYQERDALLTSAEERAAAQAMGRPVGAAWSTPNSMRGVEPGTLFRLLNRLRVEGPGGRDGAE